MNLDLVHDLQDIYRKILKTMSRPGKIENIAAVGQKVNIKIAAGKELTALLLTLLDAEVSFCFAAQADQGAAEKINQLTYALQAQPDQADYIVVSRNANNQELLQALAVAKTGSLLNPHASATVIVEVQRLSNEQQLCLSGPGIKEWAILSVDTDYDWLAAREQKVAEFPLGIDMILVDVQGNIACLPRTTRIMRQEAV